MNAGKPIAPDDPVSDGEEVSGGFSRAELGGLVVWFKWGGDRSHQHADLGSVSMLRGTEWIVGDPGTGTYNGPLDIRNYFRCSSAHSVLRVDGLEQLLPYRAFRWLNAASGSVGPPLVFRRPHCDVGSERCLPSATVAMPRRRAVILTGTGAAVVDWVDGATVGAAESIPLGPGCRWDATRECVVLSSGEYVWLENPGLGGRAPLIVAGAWLLGSTYGRWSESDRLELRWLSPSVALMVGRFASGRRTLSALASSPGNRGGLQRRARLLAARGC